ncbi:MAG: hypothetical protein ACM3SY_12990 [Candidatus Omnitrophota bacterium]
MPDYDTIDNRQSTPSLGAVTNHLRLTFSASSGSWLHVDAAYDFSPRIQDPKLFEENIFFGAIDPYSYRVTDFNSRLYPGQNKAVGSFGVFHNVDRLMVTIKTGKADILIGRQPIAWGSGRFVSPTDIIAPFAFNELDTEDRRGVDAVRVRIPLGTLDELDMGYVLGRDFQFPKSAFFLRGKVHVLKTDLSALFMGFRQHLMVGLDAARAIGGAGSWVEAAYVSPYFFVKDKKSIPIGHAYRKSYVRFSAGMDYNFPGQVYAFFEYHYNSAGGKNPSQYADLFQTPAYRDGAVYLMGQHYLNLGVTKQITPLIPFTGMVIVNMTDGSVVISPSAEYNISENMYLGGGAYIGMGKRPTLSPLTVVPPIIGFHSEFGTYPAMLYTTFRIYF